MKIKEVQDKAEELLKPIPHLPASARKWIAENIWWITIVGVVGVAYSVLISLVALAGISLFTSSFGIYSIYAHSGFWYFSTLVMLAASVIELILMATAISPLKAMHKKGWEMLFLVLLVNAAAGVLNILLSFSFGFLFSLIGLAIGVAIGAYLLFEIRSHFNLISAVGKKLKK